MIGGGEAIWAVFGCAFTSPIEPETSQPMKTSRAGLRFNVLPLTGDSGLEDSVVVD
jgi:hypothetical protein